MPGRAHWPSRFFRCAHATHMPKLPLRQCSATRPGTITVGAETSVRRGFFPMKPKPTARKHAAFVPDGFDVEKFVSLTQQAPQAADPQVNGAIKKGRVGARQMVHQLLA